jgi:hypothetical protein
MSKEFLKVNDESHFTSMQIQKKGQWCHFTRAIRIHKTSVVVILRLDAKQLHLGASS